MNRRYCVSGPTKDGGWIVKDTVTGRNAAFDRRDVQLTFAELAAAIKAADRLESEYWDRKGRETFND